MIPTHNRRALALRAVESVLAQTVQDFELVVLDDGSTDETGTVLEGLDPRLQYQWQANSGPAAARNAALRLSSAPVVTFLDSDNRWLPDHLEVVLAVLDQHPAAVLATTCPRFALGGSENTTDARLVDLLPAVLFGNTIGFLSCVAVRRNALEGIGGFDESMWVGEDSDLFARLALAGPFALISRGTLQHQRTEGSLSRRSGNRAGLLDLHTRSLARIAERAEGASDPRILAAALPARAAVAYMEAFKALFAEDVDGVRERLRDACELYPELSRDPGLALGRVVYLTAFRGGGALVALLARCWPDPRARSALTLRWVVVDAELRSHHVRAATREVLTRPSLLLRPAVALRALPGWRRWRTLRRPRAPASRASS